MDAQWKKKEGDSQIVIAAVSVMVLICGGEVGAQYMDDTLCLLANLCHYPHLWSGAVGSD